MKSGEKIIIEKIKADSFQTNIYDIIPAEMLLIIFLNNNPITTISCSPQSLIELATGYLINNRYIEKYPDIDTVHMDSKNLPENSDNSILAGRIDFFGKVSDKNLNKKKQPVLLSTGHGTIEDLVKNTGTAKIKSKVKVSYEVILKLNPETLNRQENKKESGGLHSAALFDSKGGFIAIFEDIGRHNCINKIAGYMAMNKVGVSDKIIFTTGRLSIDMIYTICKMSIPVIVTRSSITHGAALLAKKMNLTTIGYARNGRFNIYSHPSRIIKSGNLN